MDEETRFARVEVTVTSADGRVTTFAADWPAKAGVTVETGLQAALRGGHPWPSAIGASAPARLLVEVEADGRWPIAVEMRAARPVKDRKSLPLALEDEAWKP